MHSSKETALALMVISERVNLDEKDEERLVTIVDSSTENK